MFFDRKKVLLLAIIISLSSCQKTPRDAICKTDADCKTNTGLGVCHMGKCQECVTDADCFGLKQCIENVCVSACQADNDCGPNEHCQNNLCVATKRDNLDQETAAAVIHDECQKVENVHFDFDRSDIKAENKESLGKLAICMNKYPERSLTIAGHTDFRGTPSYNEALGQRRADEIKRQLVTAGIESERIKTISYGDQRPAINERNEYAYAQNRRAEFSLGTN